MEIHPHTFIVLKPSVMLQCKDQGTYDICHINVGEQRLMIGTIDSNFSD